MARIKNICFLFVLLLSATFANAQELKYRLIVGENDQLEVYNDNNTYFSGDIIIPSEVQFGNQMLPVKGIAQNAFENSTGLTSISIPASVTSIGSNAFSGCNTEVFKKARFASAEALCNITFENKEANPLFVAHHLYLGSNENAETTFTVPANISQIKAYTFVGCSDIKIFRLSDNVNEIGQDAFEGCHFTEVHYHSLDQMKGIDYEIGNSNPMAFADAVLVGGSAMPTTITFNANVKARAFKGAKSLQTITFESGINEIGE